MTRSQELHSEYQEGNLESNGDTEEEFTVAGEEPCPKSQDSAKHDG